ncbi:MAG: hypothetical protein HZB26_01085 [Candidatus Hydrogenedentes bacterium]|nr:hypothetical protein [Candidatus Hydrogenedentota bacterium]
MSLVWACALFSLVTAPDLSIEPPLDPISGTFTTVAYWRGATPPASVAFQLANATSHVVWQDSTEFSSPLRRAALRCDTGAIADGAYTLTAKAGDQSASVTLTLRQGRESLPECRPFRSRMLWMPMTGYTDTQLDDAASAGYDTLFTKVAPPYAGPGVPLDFTEADGLIKKAQARGMKAVVGWLLWVGLPPGQFGLARADGSQIANQIDPCCDAAMAQVKAYAEQLLDHYMGCRDIIALTPTWGIYGEAGYTEFNSGYSLYALEKFNRWLVARGEAQVAKLPDASDAYHWLLWHRFRFEYLPQVWGEFNGHLKRLEPNGVKIGAWQEIYNGHMYDLALSEAPGADFAINEMCFPWGMTYDQPKAIGETMGIRYKCNAYTDYKDYYLPLIARKWAEGQQAIGCQLSNSYAEENYAWQSGTAARLEFDRWEDQFAPVIRRVRDTVVIDESADVAYVQMTYPAAIYPDAGNTVTDINLYEIVLRMYGVAYDRIPITRLSRLRAADLAKYKLIVFPGAWYLDDAMWLKLKASGANVLVTGGAMQAGDGGIIADGGVRSLDGLNLEYGKTAGGDPEIAPGCPESFSRDIAEFLRQTPVALPADIGISNLANAETLLSLGGRPWLARSGAFHFISNRMLYACAYDPQRVIPKLSGSKDPSANEGDPWGLASSASPANRLGELILRNVVESSGATIRISDPLPRMSSPYLGDHVERINVTGNIAVNLDKEAHTVSIVCARPVTNFPCAADGTRWKAQVTIPAYDFVALTYDDAGAAR